MQGSVDAEGSALSLHSDHCKAIWTLDENCNEIWSGTNNKLIIPTSLNEGLKYADWNLVVQSKNCALRTIDEIGSMSSLNKPTDIIEDLEVLILKEINAQTNKNSVAQLEVGSNRNVVTCNETNENDGSKRKRLSEKPEEVLKIMSKLVEDLYESIMVIKKLEVEMSKNLRLEDHFKEVIKSQREKFRSDIRQNLGAILMGYDQMLREYSNTRDVALKISGITRLAVEDVERIISVCIQLEDRSRSQVGLNVPGKFFLESSGSEFCVDYSKSLQMIQEKKTNSRQRNTPNVSTTENSSILLNILQRPQCYNMELNVSTGGNVPSSAFATRNVNFSQRGNGTTSAHHQSMSYSSPLVNSSSQFYNLTGSERVYPAPLGQIRGALNSVPRQSKESYLNLSCVRSVPDSPSSALYRHSVPVTYAGAHLRPVIANSSAATGINPYRNIHRTPPAEQNQPNSRQWSSNPLGPSQQTYYNASLGPSATSSWQKSYEALNGRMPARSQLQRGIPNGEYHRELPPFANPRRSAPEKHFDRHSPFTIQRLAVSSAEFPPSYSTSLENVPYPDPAYSTTSPGRVSGPCLAKSVRYLPSEKRKTNSEVLSSFERPGDLPEFHDRDIRTQRLSQLLSNADAAQISSPPRDTSLTVSSSGERPETSFPSITIREEDPSVHDPTIAQKLTFKNRRFLAESAFENVDLQLEVTTAKEEPELVYLEEEIDIKKEENDDEDIEIIDEPEDLDDLGRPRPRMCAQAGCTNVGARICKGCYSVIYCSDTCQLKHWRIKHKKECNKLKELREE